MLRENKREIKASLEEVEITITEEQPDMKTPFGELLRLEVHLLRTVPIPTKYT